MASIRRLKKDIDCLTFAVVDDSLNCLAVGKSMDDISEIVQHISEPEVVNIVKKMVEYRNETRSKISARKSFNDKKEARSYYKGISIDLLKTVDGEFTRLSELVKQNA